MKGLLSGLNERRWEPCVMTAKETLAWLDEKGIRYEVCDTPVPVLVNKVSCGVPQDMGDLMIEEYNYLPNSAVRLHPMIDVPAKGDSMIEADIHEDDWLGYDDSMKEFELRAMNMTLPQAFKFECKTGTVQRTISNHPYMRLHTDKWKENGASAREVVLVEFLKKFLL